MRLREPFQGYKLSQGHFMFHMAYLIGSYISTRLLLNREELNADEQAYDCLFYLNVAHIVVPIFNFVMMHFELRRKFVLSKIFELLSIFIYQTTIFYA